MDMRRRVVPHARGAVFELGCGGGLNQRLYQADQITSFAGLDPSGKLLDFAREEATARGWQADIRQGVGEALPFADESFDTAVCTYTLCSVDQPTQVLAELRRVLKPGGKLLFLEHGLSPDKGVEKWQHRIEPLWAQLMGNCHLTRPVTSAIAGAGFDITQPGSAYTPKTPRFAGWVEWGTAVKQA